MSTIGSYKNTAFSEGQKFLVLDPETGSTSLVRGSSLVSYITPRLNSVIAESTRLAAENTDYDVGTLIQTSGATSPGDNFPATYLVVGAGEGDFPMINGNELLVIKGDEFLREQLIQNTAGDGSDLIAHTGTSDTVTEALNKRTIYVGSVAELEALSLDAGVNVYLTEEGRYGEGVIKSGSHNSDPQKGIFIDISNGNYWERTEKQIVRPEFWGATGNDATKDQPAFSALADWLSGTRSVYKAGVVGNGGGVVELHPGRTYLLSKDENDITFFVEDFNGVEFRMNGATIKSADASIPLSSLGYNWGQLNFHNGQGLYINNGVFDGNRENQSNTVGTSSGHNHGIYIFSDVKDIHITKNRFINHGSLRDGTDKRGDAIYCSAGASNIYVVDNYFRNQGRWAFTIENGAGDSYNVHFRGNKTDYMNRNDGAIQLGAVDFENLSQAGGEYYIQDNTFLGSSAVYFGGGGPSPQLSEWRGIYIQNNQWITGDVFNSSYDRAVMLQSRTAFNYRTYSNVTISGNRWKSDNVPSQIYDLGLQAKLKNAIISDNYHDCGSLSSSTLGCMRLFFNGVLEGDIVVQGNFFKNTGAALITGPEYEDPAAPNYNLLIRNNTFESCNKAWVVVVGGTTFDSGHHVKFQGNIARNIPDENYIRANGSEVIFYDKNLIIPPVQFDTGGTVKVVGDMATTVEPAVGYWYVGEIAYRSDPAPGGNIGWVCVTEGEAGAGAVFKEFGVISA